MLEKSDKLIVLFSFMFFSLFAYKFANFNEFEINQSSEQLIAHVQNIELIAKRKINGSLNWSSLSSNSSIFNGDQVFTDSDSKVEIKFNDSSSIVIPENTLIRIEKNTDGINLDLKRGLVDLDLSKFKNKKVRVQIGKRKIQLSGSDKAIVKIKRVNGDVTLTTNGEGVLASEIPDASSPNIKSEQKTIRIRRNEKVLIKGAALTKWQGELAQVGRRVDTRLVKSQSIKIQKILNSELSKASKIVKSYKDDSKKLVTRSKLLDMTPKVIALSELEMLKKSVSKKDRPKIERSIKRIRTVRNIAPLKSSVENYIKVKFPRSKVLQSIANEEVLLAKKENKYKSNEELLSSIGKKFDQLDVTKPSVSYNNSFENKLREAGKSVNKTVAYAQLKEIKKTSPSKQVLKSSELAFEKVFKEKSTSSPLLVASTASPILKKNLVSFKKEKIINKEILKEISPIIKKEYSKENVKKITSYIKSYEFSNKELKAEKELVEIFTKKLSSIEKKNSKGWSTILSSTGVRLDKEVRNEKALQVVDSKIILNKVRSTLLLSSNDPSYKEIEKELQKVDFTKKSSVKKELQLISKKLEAKKVSTPKTFSKNSWTRKLSVFSKKYEQDLINSQKDELISQVPELKNSFIAKRALITKSPKQEVKSIIANSPKLIKKIGPAKLEEALVNTQDITIDKQDLFEKINETLSLETSPKAQELIQSELRQAEFKHDDFSVEETLVTIGKKLDSLNIKPVQKNVVANESFLGSTTIRERPIISKALPSQVEAGEDVKLITSKSVGAKSSYEVEFSKDKSFKTITYKKKISSKSQKLNFTKNGKFFYRVSKSANNDEIKSFDISHTKAVKKFSPVKTIEILPAKAPEVIVSNAGAIDTKIFSSFPVKWSGKNNSQYEVEITQTDPKTNKVLLKKNITVKKNNVRLDLSKVDLNLSVDKNIITAKDVSYRVRKSGRVKSSWSQPVKSTVSIPLTVMPVQDKKVYVKRRFKKKTVIPFKWKSSLKGDTHVLSVAKDKDFKKLIVKKEVVGNRADVTTSYEGPIFWKVVPKKLSTKSVGPVMQKSILSSTIRIDKKVVKSTIEQSNTALSTKVDVGWRYTRKTDTKLKEVELATDPNFKNIIAKKSVPTKKKSTSFNVKGVGQYFWRVKDVGAKSKNISGVNSFSVVENVDLEIPEIIKKQIINYKIVNELPAYEIILPKAPGISMIELEVYSDENMKNLVFKKRFTRNRALWVTNRAGKFYYRVRSISKTGKKSKFSPVGKLIFPVSPLIRSDLE